MGYESKIIIVNHYSKEFTEKIAEYKASEMRYIFPDLFESDFDGKICEEHFEELTNKDCYGNKIKYTKDFKKVIDFLEKEEKKEHYRRLKPLIGLLKGFNPEEWNNLIILYFEY